ncbi:OLC1v1003902C2 [Oldenlandia corymbosa var. corymbosa]|uniref:OLC1v1003902C2 n=2 Tax=Oldenlandia corymbosa var. corymbosa TaxID=529605 RepID=A0AAV1DB09_OLDCO|nr:OLC1v1003902C2 [Oldenlandia corymbosa var. corymbosa]
MTNCFQKKKMGVVEVEPGCCEGIAKGVNIGDDEYQNLIGILDFPMESLEGDDDLGGDWDASKSQSLGPIPTDALMGLSPVPQANTAYLDAPQRVTTPGAAMFKPKQLPNYAKQSSSTSSRNESKLSDSQESGVFQTQSPVSVLESGGSCPGGKSLPIKPDIIVPVRSRSKRARASVFNPWFVMTPISSAAAAMKKTSSYKKPKERRDRLPEESLLSSSASEMTDDSFKQVKEELFHAADGEDDGNSLQQALPTKQCTHCQVTKTPQWREGPMGPKTLCNACGVRYRSGRLFPEYRPLASPTFVPTLHSNSHRKVVELRKKAVVQEDGTIIEAPLSPAPEFTQSLNPRRRVLGTRNRGITHEKDFVYDTCTSPAPEIVPKRRKVIGTTKEASMQETNSLHNTVISQAPEFVETLDSNSSGKYTGMRKKAIMLETDGIPDDAPMSPAPEFVPMSSYLFDFIY